MLGAQDETVVGRLGFEDEAKVSGLLERGVAGDSGWQSGSSASKGTDGNGDSGRHCGCCFVRVCVERIGSGKK